MDCRRKMSGWVWRVGGRGAAPVVGTKAEVKVAASAMIRAVNFMVLLGKKIASNRRRVGQNVRRRIAWTATSVVRLGGSSDQRISYFNQGGWQKKKKGAAVLTVAI